MRFIITVLIQFDEWLRLSSEITIIPQESKVEERRTWKCNLNSTEAQIPCGGTHVKNLNFFKSIHSELNLLSQTENDKEYFLEMRVTSTPRS